CMQALEFPFIF
nr:immunoglobulin light chain junction region [Macaca mulatta]